ncbi:prephenate dehydratase [Methanomicrobium sp. W14]|uniref:prephenate dehydratase n=1 Tax=Methanomicrobium sp. W14 TaxID=2817839 RepID=UPI001AEB498A|nr:prephenate dehydratase [Methanomicrobium sp. W14]MBP2134108.1 prephenate dehydratase [Methanomicrobium sp. W14]
MTIAALGPKGTFSHELAEKIKRKDEEVLLFPTIKDVFREVCLRKTKGVRGIVPVENSEAGGVGETLDAIMTSECRIFAEYYMPIHHLFVSGCSHKDISVIYTHPQSHEQCSIFLEKLENIPVIHTSSNAQSAKEAKTTANSAAVTTETAAKLYNLPVLKKDIQNSGNNTTRFLEISAEGTLPENPEKCSIVIIPKENRPGLLYGILEIFARKNINLTRIESRPSKDGIGRYVFFIDFETGENCRDAISELKTVTVLKELGCYSRKEL